MIVIILHLPITCLDWFEIMISTTLKFRLFSFLSPDKSKQTERRKILHMGLQGCMQYTVRFLKEVHPSVQLF